MAKFISDTLLDQALNYLKTNGSRQDICSTQPTTYAEASSTYSLGNVTMDSSDYTGPSDGDTNGRKIRVNQQTGVSISATGSAQHVAITNGSNALYAVTTITTQSVTSGNTATINAWDWEIADVTA